ncbi:MAG: pitrilysin family protein [Elusimicrobiota bacterium]
MTSITKRSAAGTAEQFLPTDKFVLPNKVKVMVKEDHSLPLVSVYAWVRTGAVNENDKINGISHFLEHMLFKGTKNRSTGEISYTVESLGGRMNAATSNEFTVYYVDIPSEHVAVAVDLLADMTNNASFPPEELDRERLVILEEIKRRDDDSDNALIDELINNLYTQSLYRYRVIGSSETVSAITRDELVNYYKSRYAGDNVTLVVVGDVNPKKVYELAKGTFGKLPGKKVKDVTLNLIEPVKERFVVSKHKPVQTAIQAVAMLGPDIESDDQYAMELLAMILGHGRASRFNKVLREDKQLVYGIGSGFWSQKGSGMFIVNMRGDDKNMTLAYDEVCNQLNIVKEKGVTPEELQRVKKMSTNNWLFSNETYSGQANTIGYAVVVKDLSLVKEALIKIGKVTLDDVKRVANKYFVQQKPSYVVYLPETSGK